MYEPKLFAQAMTAIILLFGAASISSLAQRLPLATGVKKVCTIEFNKDSRRPARVEDAALPCLEQAAKRLKATPNIKLVLVGISHPLYDREDQDHGMEREGEDMTGLDIRFSDVAAYRVVNTKAYLTQWLGADPTKIIPTTDEYALGRQVIIYAVPGDASFFHNYTKTTPTNESKCTVKPCPNPLEDVLTPQARPRIQ
ncbi:MULTISPECIES: hypothetical protein [Acidobacteriaceae]|uniref:hypothetical protein n=1 Tax=Acidobacteriaceae TaxID=204434 RepID=UPI00131B4E01|nr:MULTISPECIES: hypothetical protein [Acidobacteriaceae]MDW5264670.1 hypothetical protein [Edaphobacter sp.]